MGGKATSYHFGVCSENERGSYLRICSPLTPPVVHQPPHLSVIFGIQMTWQGAQMPTSLNEGRSKERCSWVGDLIMWQAYDVASVVLVKKKSHENAPDDPPVLLYLLDELELSNLALCFEQVVLIHQEEATDKGCKHGVDAWI